MRTVTLYTRRDCCLCDEARKVLDSVRRVEDFALEVVDVDQTPELARKYGLEVPVVTIDGRKAFKYRVDPKGLLARLRGEGIFARWLGRRR